MGVEMIANLILVLQSMSTYSREDLHTDRSIQLDSESDSPQRYQSSSIYLDKLEAQMAFMEKEFRRNIEWQRSLINEARKEQKKSSRHQRKNSSIMGIRLKPKEEERLKQVLRDYCSIPQGRLELSQLVKLAINLKQNGHSEQEKENRTPFPLIPRVITLNDLAPSTQHQLDSSKVSPIRMAESRVKVPKYRKPVKNPHQLFSPEPEEPIKMMMNFVQDEPVNTSSRPKAMEDSLGKRLQAQDDNNFVTFREYLSDSFRNKPSENVSLNFSSSRKEELCCNGVGEMDKDSLLLLSDDENPQQNPSIYLQLKLTQQKQSEQRYKKEQEFLRFSATKKRKIGKNKELIPRHPLPRQDDSKLRIKKLHDSFGKIYEEFEQVKPHYQNDRETLESDD